MLDRAVGRFLTLALIRPTLAPDPNPNQASPPNPNQANPDPNQALTLTQTRTLTLALTLTRLDRAVGRFLIEALSKTF